MDDQTLLQAECIVAVMGVEGMLKERPRAPSEVELRRAVKLPDVLRKRVGELVDMTKQSKAAAPPELPDYRQTNEALTKATAHGLDQDAMVDVLLPVPAELQPICSLVWQQAIGYLANLFPRRIEQRLTGPYLQDPSPGEWAEFGWAWRMANSPLFAIDLAGDGMLISAEVGHMKAMYPALHAEMCADILDALTEKAAADKDWQVPWWLQKQLCAILGTSPVSASLVADIDQAVKQSQAETKSRASALKLSQTGTTTSQALAGNPK